MVPVVDIEAWHSIPGYEGLYEVSNHGRTRQGPANRWPGFIRKDQLSWSGRGGSGQKYRSTVLKKAGRYRTLLVHRLVLAAFVGPCPNGHETNNMVGNLEWVTASQNQIHRRDVLGKPLNPRPARGERVTLSKLNPGQVGEVRRLRSAGMVQQRIADLFGVSQATVSSIVLRKTWRHVEDEGQEKH